jgi:hypothetical protein
MKRATACYGLRWASRSPHSPRRILKSIETITGKRSLHILCGRRKAKEAKTAIYTRLEWFYSHGWRSPRSSTYWCGLPL